MQYMEIDKYMPKYSRNFFDKFHNIDYRYRNKLYIQFLEDDSKNYFLNHCNNSIYKHLQETLIKKSGLTCFLSAKVALDLVILSTKMHCLLSNYFIFKNMNQFHEKKLCLEQ